MATSATSQEGGCVAGSALQSSSSSSASVQSPRARVRKRSLFGRAPKPALPASDLIPEPVASPNPGPSTLRSTPAHASKSVLPALPPGAAIQAHTPSRPFRFRTHGRSPSTSTLSSISASHADSALDSALPLHDDFLNGTKSAANSSPTMHAPSSSTAWYQRNPLSRSSLSMKSGRTSAPGRERSSSVNEQNLASNMIGARLDPANESSSAGWSGPGSPSPLRRTFSRRSVYSIQSEASANEVPHGGQTPVEGGEKPQSTKESRKLFGRSSRAPIGDASVGMQAHDRQGAAGLQPGYSFLRRPSSHSFARSGNGERGNHEEFAASTDSLSSTATSTASRGLAKRASDMLSRTTQIGHWSRKARDGDVHDDARPEEVSLEQRPAHTSFPGSDETVGELNSHQGAHVGEAIPKRLSGWLSQMLGSEGIASESQQHTIKASESVATLKDVTTCPPSLHQSEAPIMAGSSSSSSQMSNGRPTTSSVAPRLRTAGLLSTLAASGRARNEAGAANAAVSSARSGLDRALRYFMDNHDEPTTDEGIWLLGVWHGPIEEKTDATISAATLSPAVEASITTADRSDTAPSHREGTISSKRCSDPDHDDSSSLASSAQRTRETSPSIASGSSGRSVPKGREGVVDQCETASVEDEGAIVAHNPPTPHASPSLKYNKATAGGRRTDVGKESSANLKSVVPVASEHTRTFQTDFHSRIWCTYRSHFTPIARDGTISEEAESAAADTAARPSPRSANDEGRSTPSTTQPANGVANKQTPERTADTPSDDDIHASAGPHSPSSGGLGAAFGITTSPVNAAPVSASGGGGSLGEKMGIPNLWNRATAAAQAYGLAGRAGLTTDAGWGCMLRTGQSVLANALLNVHLGREWRRLAKPRPISMAPVKHDDADAYQRWCDQREQFACYARLLSWFMDEPSSACPFGVHRMAREGKRLGKEVGEWFGPSTASGAIKKLVDDFPECGLGVSVASDGVIYLDQVKAQAQRLPQGQKRGSNRWSRPVLVLIGVRLGLEGVHPMYHDSVKQTFAFPQSVGIAGGRPSSSYYFVGYQGNSLFYLDPHHVRPSVPFQHPPSHHGIDAEWWAQAYAEGDLATFHNDRPRRMPMKSLDPSMLLGFLIKDEDALHDFIIRVKALPRPIFSVLDSMPRWMMTGSDDMDAEDSKAIESISESSAEESASDGRAAEEDEDGDGSLVAIGRRDLRVERELPRRRHGAQGGANATIVGSQIGERIEVDHATSVERSRTARSVVSTKTSSTPRSEGTFEFVERQPMPAHRQPPQSRPIAFPSLGSYDSVEEPKTGKQEPQMSDPGLPYDGDAEGDAEFEAFAGGDDDDDDDDDDDGRRASAPHSCSELDAAWEDVQPDVLPSPQSDLYVLRPDGADDVVRDDVLELGPSERSAQTPNVVDA